MLRYESREIPNTLAETVDPGHTALIVHELLNDFCAEGGALDKMGHRIDTSEILPPIVELLASARASGVRVIYVRYTTHADRSHLSDPAILRFLGGAWSTPGELPQWAVDGTWGWSNLEEVAPLPEEPIVKKFRPDMFFSTPLDALLRWNKIRTAVVVGIGAEVGLVPSVLHGDNLGYFMVAPEDCICPADASRREDALLYIRDVGITPTSAEILEAWKR